ncbi:MAG: phbB [Herminiimonas sp.]|nr:phbB [Herminiimonas sp.]
MDRQKIALVTGGMGGLGEAICQRMFKSGYRVVATCSPENQQAQLWQKSQKDAGFEFRVYKVDVAEYASCEAGVRMMLDDMGHIDVLVNNAGITRDSTLRKMSAENWRIVLRTNLDSLFNMTQPVLDNMVRSEWGRIINISSVNAQKGAAGQTNYAATKAGIHGFTKALALELARKGITVNTISPGYLRTRMVMKVPPDILNNKIIPEIPVGRLGEPAEVAGLVDYLASNAAAFITGANIAINGGQHMS